MTRPRGGQVGLAGPRHPSVSCSSWCLAIRKHSNLRPNDPYFLGYRLIEVVAQLRLRLLVELYRSNTSWSPNPLLGFPDFLAPVMDRSLLVLHSDPNSLYEGNGRWGLWEREGGNEGGALMNKISALIMKTPESSLFSSTLWGQDHCPWIRKYDPYQTKNLPAPWPWTWLTLTLKFLAFKKVKNKCC